jgi:hypothetical protein
MLVGGLVLLGGSYLASVAVAATSTHQGDHYLYLPVAGPWLDLADRGACGAGTTSCDKETWNKALLVGDGILQGLGALSIVMSLFTSQRSARATAKATVFVKPTALGRGTPGLAVLGTF